MSDIAFGVECQWSLCLRSIVVIRDGWFVDGIYLSVDWKITDRFTQNRISVSNFALRFQVLSNVLISVSKFTLKTWFVSKLTLIWYVFWFQFRFLCFLGDFFYDGIDLWYFAHFLCFVSMFLFSCIGVWVWIFTASFAIGFYGHLRWCSGMSFVMISTSSCGGMCMGILVNENFHWFLWSFAMSSVSWSVSWFRRIGCGMHMSFRMCIS